MNLASGQLRASAGCHRGVDRCRRYGPRELRGPDGHANFRPAYRPARRVRVVGHEPGARIGRLGVPRTASAVISAAAA